MKIPNEIGGRTVEELYAAFKKRHTVTMFDPTYTAPPARWLVEGLFLHPGKILGILGESNAGKSRFLRWLIAHLLSGKRPFDLRSDADLRKILYCGSEEHYDDFFTNLCCYGDLIGADMEDWGERIVHMEGSGMALEILDNRRSLLATVAYHDAELVILDSLRYFHSTEEKGSPALTAMINDLRRWTNRYRFSLLPVHHTGKLSVESDRSKIYTWVRGDSHIAAAMDSIVALERFATKEKIGNAGSKVKLYRFGRHAPTTKPWTVTDLGRSDEHQPQATDLGWTDLMKG